MFMNQIQLRILTSLVALMALLSIMSAHCHELPDNRVTMVLRDETHISLTFYVDYPDVLNLALAPKKSHREFLLAYSAMTPEDFHKEMLRAQQILQTETRAMLNGGGKVVITGWVWPDSTRVQATIQREVMQAMVGTSANAPHPHEAPTEIRANIAHNKPIKDANIQFAEAFGKILLVSYRPKQIWLKHKEASLRIEF
jgi:hypothetical protein